MAHDTGDADIGDVHYEVPLEGRQIGGRDLRSKTDPLGRDIDNFLRNLFGGEEVGRQPTPNLGVLPQAPTRGVNGDVRINDVNRIRESALNIPVPPIANALNLTGDIDFPRVGTPGMGVQDVNLSRGGAPVTPPETLMEPGPPRQPNVAASTAVPSLPPGRLEQLAAIKQRMNNPNPNAVPPPPLPGPPTAAPDIMGENVPYGHPGGAFYRPDQIPNYATAPISATDILPTTDQIPATPDLAQVLVEAETPNTPVGTVASPEASEDINIKRSVPIGEGEQGGQSPTSAGRLLNQFGEGLVRELSKLAPDVSALIPEGATNVGLSDLFKGESGSAEANVPNGAPTAPGVSDNILDNFDDEFYTAPRTAPPLPPGREDELAAIKGRRDTPINAPPLPGSPSDIATAAFAAPDAPGAFDPETGIATLDPNDTDGIIALANSLADASEAQRAGVLNSLDQETKIAVLARLDEMDQITQAGGDID